MYNIILQVTLHQEDGGFWVECPSLPSCFSQGETEEEALVNIKEAIELYIEVLMEDYRLPLSSETINSIAIVAA